MPRKVAARPAALTARVRRLERDVLKPYADVIERENQAAITRWLVEREEAADLYAEALERTEHGDHRQPATLRILSQRGGIELLDAITASLAAVDT